MEHLFAVTYFTKEFWVPQDHTSKQSHTNKELWHLNKYVWHQRKMWVYTAWQLHSMGKRSDQFTPKSVSYCLGAMGYTGSQLVMSNTWIICNQFLLRECGEETIEGVMSYSQNELIKTSVSLERTEKIFNTKAGSLYLRNIKSSNSLWVS